MRTQLLLILALLVGADVAHAQQWPAYPYNQPSLGYAPYYPQATPWAGPPGGQPVVMPPEAFLPSAGALDAPVEEAGPAPTGGGGTTRRGCGQGKSFWISGGGLIGFVRPDRLPLPLVTGGTDINVQRPGGLGQPGTFVMFGNELHYDEMYGGQLEFGCFLDADQVWSTELRGFYLYPAHLTTVFVSDDLGDPLITRPIINVDPATNDQASFLTSFPGLLAGRTQIDARSEIYGGEFNVRCHQATASVFRLDGLVGFRFLHLRESLRISDELRPLTPNSLTFLGERVPLGATVTDEDFFRATNHFYGGQLGGRLIFEDEWLYFSLFGKVALGLTTERAEISGQSTLEIPGATMPQIAEGGIQAVATNSGLRNRTIFGVVPEWGATVGVSVTSWCRVTAGYSCLLWNRVFRPGDLIDPRVNPTQVPTASVFTTDPANPAVPEYRLKDSPFWVQTVNAGLELYF